MATAVIIGYNPYTNDVLSFYDATDYVDVTIQSINQVRYLFATYNSLLAPSESVDDLVVGYEYEVVSGTITLNGYDYTAGQKFIPYESAEVTGGVVNATGWYSVYTSAIPSDALPVEFTPSLVGDSGDLFLDAMRFVRYEIYDTEHSAGTIVVSTATQFIVRGDVDDSILIGAAEIFVGQVFYKSATFTFTGTPTIVEYYDTSTTDFWTDGNSTAVYQDYINNLSTDVLNQSQDYKDNFIRTFTCLNLPYLSADRQTPYDTTAIQASFNVITNYLSIKDNNIK